MLSTSVSARTLYDWPTSHYVANGRTQYGGITSFRYLDDGDIIKIKGIWIIWGFAVTLDTYFWRYQDDWVKTGNSIVLNFKLSGYNRILKIKIYYYDGSNPDTFTRTGTGNWQQLSFPIDDYKSVSKVRLEAIDYLMFNALSIDRLNVIYHPN